MACDLFLFAGEKSGDLHGEKLLQALIAKNPSLNIKGVGGPLMRAQGMESVLPMEEFQVMGFVDVFFALPKLRRHFHLIANEILRSNPKIVVTIDYPGFNLRLIKHLRKRGFRGKCVHFICPSVWAWGKKRIALMSEHLDLLLCILPFEKELFSSTPLKAAYVGHPLTERLRTYGYKTLALPKDKKVIALFPGSRKKEIERNLPLYLKVCQDLLQEREDLCIALSVSEERFRPLIETILQENGGKGKILLIDADHTYELMKSAYAAIAKSGTVTLELALHRVPTVVTYGVSRLDMFIAWHLLRIRLPFYCLVNIIARKEVFAELIGPRFTFESLKQKVLAILEPARAECLHHCATLIAELGDKNTAKAAAEEIFS